MVLNWKKYIAECIGTFVLVFVACGVAIVTSANVVATALGFGLVIVAMAYTIGHISGCHINPAVSLAMFFTGKLSAIDFAGYVAAQFTGAVTASFMHFLFFENMSRGSCNYGANYIYETVDGSAVLGSLTLEIILTFIFVLVILVVTSKPEHSGISGMVIGLTLTLVHLIGIPMTGTSVNPARSFGPALFAEGAIADYWVFFLAPAVGAVGAAFVYMFLFKEKKTIQ